jgi:hypothetical protein
MTERGVTESVVEQDALAWLEAVGWRILRGPDIASVVLADGDSRTFMTLCGVSEPQLNFTDLRVKDAQGFVAEAL